MKKVLNICSFLLLQYYRKSIANFVFNKVVITYAVIFNSKALDVMEAHDETGPLQPKHLREAVRRLRLQGQIPNGRAHKAFFRL